MFKKLFISCDEATMICDKSQYNEASFFEKIQINLHFLQCKICKLYTKQNNKMSGLFKMNSVECKKRQNSLSDKDKEIFKEQLKQYKV